MRIFQEINSEGPRYSVGADQEFTAALHLSGGKNLRPLFSL